jgi:hypothetical protein
MNASLRLTLVCGLTALASTASAQGIGTLRADYSGPMSLEINAELNAIPIIDIEVGVSPISQFAHGAAGFRIDALPRDGASGFAVKIVILASAWFRLGDTATFHGGSINPGVAATYWFSPHFGLTANLAVPVFIPIGMGSVTTVSAFPRVGAGISF